MAQYNPIPDDIMNEIIAGAGGTIENKAENAISFLEQWSKWIADFITIIKDFFDRIAEVFSA